MLNDFIKEVIGLVIGKQFEEIGLLLDNKKYINEFLIAKKMNITINQTRNLLYRLADQGLVSSIRKKDKKKGWYTYFWKIESTKVLEFLEKVLRGRIEQLENQIKSRGTKQFYVCKTCNIEFNEENALLYDFTCNECGDIFSLKDDTKLLKELGRNKDKLLKELQALQEILGKEKEKIDKTRQKEIAKVKAAKKEARKKSAKKAAATRKVKADAKNSVKKKVAEKNTKSTASKKSIKKIAKQSEKKIKKLLKKVKGKIKK